MVEKVNKHVFLRMDGQMGVEVFNLVCFVGIFISFLDTHEVQYPRLRLRLRVYARFSV